MVNVVAMIRVSKLLGSNYNPSPNPNFNLILLFGRSRIIVSHHRLTDELFPAAAIFCSPYAL